MTGDPAGRAERAPAEVRIRAAGEGDLVAVLDLFRRLDGLQRPWRVFEPRAGALAETEARYREALTERDRILVVAEEGGRLVGMGHGAVVRPSSMSDARALEISNVVVLPSRRRRGVARAIVAELVAFGRGRGARTAVIKTFAANEAAVAFWSDLGFRVRLVQMVADLGDLSGE